MQDRETKKTASNVTDRRDFLRKAVVGAAFVVPVMQTVTSRALAQNGVHGQTGGYFTVQVTIDTLEEGGTGVVDPPGATVLVPLGGSRIFTATPAGGSYIYKMGVDGSNSGPYYAAHQVTISDNGLPVRTLYVQFTLG